jgi:hypothetical protein
MYDDDEDNLGLATWKLGQLPEDRYGYLYTGDKLSTSRGPRIEKALSPLSKPSLHEYVSVIKKVKILIPIKFL